MSEYPSFPEGWIEQRSPLPGASLPDFLRSYAQPPVRGLRVRPRAMRRVTAFRNPAHDGGGPANRGYSAKFVRRAGRGQTTRPAAPARRQQQTDEAGSYQNAQAVPAPECLRDWVTPALERLQLG